MVARVAVSAAVFAIDKPYSYRVPAELQVRPGMRVLVPFGRGNRRCEAMVLALEEAPEEQLKAIERCLDEEPLLEEEGLRLAAFLRDRYFCTFYDAVKAMLPAGLWFRPVERIAAVPDSDWRETVCRQPVAAEVMERLEELGGEADYAVLCRQFPDEEQLRKALRYLLGKKLVTSHSDFLKKASDKTERIAQLSCPAEEAMEYAERRRRAAPMQYEVLRLLCAIGRGSSKEICYFTGADQQVLRRLEKLGLVELIQEPVLRRVPLQIHHDAEPIILNEDQRTAYDGLCRQWEQEQPGAALLYGVTGSGKTAVYLQLIRRCLDAGKTALMLVPEISLTPQLLELVASHFGDRVAVLHSRLRMGERYDEWKRIRGGSASVVVGTRSAVFAPLHDLGLLIIDEEQEHTYKSENNPRYHAREVALFRGLRSRALVVLGSATPSVETMYHAQIGDYQLYRLPSRYNGGSLPTAQLVDMKQELKNGNGTAISRPLEAALRTALAQGRQAILFLNRRGASRCLVCVDCGTVPQCPRCSVNLTYHAANRRLMCHYCGHSEPLPEHCPICGGHLKQVGVGTQKVEEELAALLPDAAVLRMDADTVSAVNNHEKLLNRFEQEKIPILLGTQMVAKGLNFENVTLVGVLDADMSLYVDNFRAAESTFSMITQVVGRSGRGAFNGTAMIQTMTPENAVLQLAAQQDYDKFYQLEIALRRLRGSPPFRDLLVVTFSGVQEDAVLTGAHRFRQALGQMLSQPAYQDVDLALLGPAPASVARVNNRYRYRLTLHCVNSKKIRQLLAYLLREFAKDRYSRGVSAFADCNPYD